MSVSEIEISSCDVQRTRLFHFVFNTHEIKSFDDTISQVKYPHDGKSLLLIRISNG